MLQEALTNVLRHAPGAAADDQELVRSGIRMILEGESDMEVAGEAADGQQAFELVRQVPVDVLLMDVRMPGEDGILTNPPFGSKIVATSIDVQRTFSLGYKWSLDKASGRYIRRTSSMSTASPPVSLTRTRARCPSPGALRSAAPAGFVTRRLAKLQVRMLRAGDISTWS